MRLKFSLLLVLLSSLATVPAQSPATDHAPHTFAVQGDHDTREFTKGELWLNGRALGRIWNIGPQQTLYAPGPWLVKGKNEVVVFDLQGKMGSSLRGLDKPVLDGTVPPS
ncbi:MAG: hypothetical protein ABI158_15280 [Edaphobacter sp.]